MHDLAKQFAQMQNYAAALHSLITDAEAHAPQHSEGADRSRAVRVTLGPDGLPRAFRVEAEWKRRIEPAAFGAAVVEAFQAAVGDRLATWSRTLEDGGWKAKAEQLTGDANDKAIPAQSGRSPHAFRQPVSAIRSRPIGDLSRQQRPHRDRHLGDRLPSHLHRPWTHSPPASVTDLRSGFLSSAMTRADRRKGYEGVHSRSPSTGNVILMSAAMNAAINGGGPPAGRSRRSWLA